MISNTIISYNHQNTNSTHTRTDNPPVSKSQLNFFDVTSVELPDQIINRGLIGNKKVALSIEQENIDMGANQILEFENGSRYEGAIQNGRPHGYGKQIFLDNTNYEGQFEDGLPHGHGILTCSNGSRYEGTFVNGSRKGKFCLTLPNNTKFTGRFAEGNFVGTVTMSQVGCELVEGKFDKDNKFITI